MGCFYVPSWAIWRLCAGCPLFPSAKLWGKMSSSREIACSRWNTATPVKHTLTEEDSQWCLCKLISFRVRVEFRRRCVGRHWWKRIVFFAQCDLSGAQEDELSAYNSWPVPRSYTTHAVIRFWHNLNCFKQILFKQIFLAVMVTWKGWLKLLQKKLFKINSVLFLCIKECLCKC